jgi:hypothetical protein
MRSMPQIALFLVRIPSKVIQDENIRRSGS